MKNPTHKQKVQSKKQCSKESMDTKATINTNVHTPKNISFDFTPLKFVREEDGTVTLRNNERFSTLQETIGLKDLELGVHILEKAWYAMSPSNTFPPEFGNIILQSLCDQNPKDAMEARLIAQAVVLFSKGMEYMNKAAETERLDHAQHYGNMALKLLKLHSETTEALQRYRRGGEQRVTVQHIHVNQGIQVAVEGGGILKTEEEAHGTTSTMRSQIKNQLSQPMSIKGSEKREMPVSRGPEYRTN